jgi:hypothetical protein
LFIADGTCGAWETHPPANRQTQANVLLENTARTAREKTCDILTRHRFILLIFPAQRQFNTKANIRAFVTGDVELTLHASYAVAGNAQPQTTSFNRTFSLMTPWKKGSKIIVFSSSGSGCPCWRRQ